MLHQHVSEARVLPGGRPSAHTHHLPCAREAVTFRPWNERPVGCRKALGSAVPGGTRVYSGHVTCRKGPASGRSHSRAGKRRPRLSPGLGCGAAAGARGFEAGAGERRLDPGPPLGETAAARRPTQAGRPQAAVAVFPAPSPLPRRPPRKIPAPGSAPRPIGPALARARILFVPQPFQAPDRRQRRFGRKARAPEASGMVWDRVGWR